MLVNLAPVLGAGLLSHKNSGVRFRTTGKCSEGFKGPQLPNDNDCVFFCLVAAAREITSFGLGWGAAAAQDSLASSKKFPDYPDCRVRHIEARYETLQKLSGNVQMASLQIARNCLGGFQMPKLPDKLWSFGGRVWEASEVLGAIQPRFGFTYSKTTFPLLTATSRAPRAARSCPRDGEFRRPSESLRLRSSLACRLRCVRPARRPQAHSVLGFKVVGALEGFRV